MARPLSHDARLDAAGIVRYYSAEAGADVALRFSAALRAGVEQLRAFPESGSTRFASVTGIVGLRALPLQGFPYLIFYRVEGNTPMILRILHTARDIPSSLRP